MTEKYPASITKALHAIMEKTGYVQKKGRNKFHGYSYAGEADLLEVLRPAMLEHGLLLLPSGIEQTPVDQYGNTHVSVAYTLAHKDGDVWPDKLIALGCGNDKNSKGGVGDKGTYKALTGANKYLLFKLFQIETGDDPEATEREATPPPPDVSPHETPNMPKIPTSKKKWDETDWRRFSADFKKMIDSCQTTDSLNEIVARNERLKELEGISKPMYDALMDYAEGREQILATPTDGLGPLDAG